MDTKSLMIGIAAALVAQVAFPDGIRSSAPRAITYEEFGAAGDGTTDDREAIVAAHKAANAKGLPVRAKDGATYCIGGAGKSAIIKTDVDFGTAKFILDDTKVPRKYITVPAFSIIPDASPVPVNGIGPLAKGQKSLGVKLPGRCLVRLENSGVMRFIRQGRNRTDGAPQQEMVIADGDGRIDPSTPLVWDYEKVTSAKAWPLGGRTITVKGGVFTTIANQAESRYTYYIRGFSVRRSNVRIEGMSNYVTGELDHGAPYSGFLRILDCANVTVTGCVFAAHRMYETIGKTGQPVGMGSYGIAVGSAVNVSFIGCRQTTDILDNRYWGLFGSNYCRNLLFDNCEFSRFDAHMGVANATIRNSTLGHMGVKAIGFGTLLIENTTVRSSGAMVELRSDYGSSWDGEIVIRNCKYAPIPGRSTRMPPLIAGSNLGTHDYGYDCTMPRRIVIDGLEIDDSAWTGARGETCIFAPFDRKCDGDGVRPYPVPEEVTLRNVHTASGRPLKTSRNMSMFGKVKIVQSE